MPKLPWEKDRKPLMLAPMQGLTNEALRSCFIEHYQPDIVFTEFVRVQGRSRKNVLRSDVTEVKAHHSPTPLIVQLIGHDAGALASAALEVQAAGCEHVNLNLGCPYGRMTTGATGGELLKTPEVLPDILTALREATRGSFSVKCRSGHQSPDQIFSLLPIFEDAGVDFIILHPRTVEQQYSGCADHNLTFEVAGRARIPVIANGDINSVEMASGLLEHASLAGLMIGRGALADPGLFQKIRKGRSDSAIEIERRRDVAEFIGRLLPLYLSKFCGERQALMKVKDVLNFIPDPALQRDLKKLKRTTTYESFNKLLAKQFPL